MYSELNATLWLQRNQPISIGALYPYKETLLVGFKLRNIVMIVIFFDSYKFIDVTLVVTVLVAHEASVAVENFVSGQLWR